jgi:hypothetical protein
MPCFASANCSRVLVIRHSTNNALHITRWDDRSTFAPIATCEMPPKHRWAPTIDSKDVESTHKHRRDCDFLRGFQLARQSASTHTQTCLLGMLIRAFEAPKVDRLIALRRRFKHARIAADLLLRQENVDNLLRRCVCKRARCHLIHRTGD